MASDIRALPAALYHRPFLIYFAGHAVSLVGTSAQRVALPWLVWQASGSALLIGVMLFLESTLALVTCFFAGIAVDRLDRLRMVVCAKLLSFAHAIALVVIGANGWIDPVVLVALSCVRGLSVGINQPVRIAATVALARPHETSSALALDAVSSNASVFVGPVIAALLISLGETWFVFLFNALTYLPLFYAIYHVRAVLRASSATGGSGSSLLANTLRFYRRPDVAWFMATRWYVAMAVFPLPAFVSALTTTVYGGSAATYGLLASMIGLGALSAGILLAYRPQNSWRWRELLVFELILCAAAALLVSVNALPIAVAALAVFGAAASSSRIVMNVMIRQTVAHSLYGRAVTLAWISVTGGEAVGGLLIGLGAQWIGLAPTLFILAASVMTLLPLCGRWTFGADVEPAIDGRVERDR